jgi:hypothetical protein
VDRPRPPLRRPAPLVPLLALLPAFAACAPAAPPPPGPPEPALPALPPAALDDPGWALLLRPQALLDGPAPAALLRGLGLADAVDAFFAGHGIDPATLGWIRVESSGDTAAFVVPAAAGPAVARALDSVAAGAPSLPRAEPPSPGDRPPWTAAVDGEWAVVRRAPAASPAALPAADPAAPELARLLRRSGAPELLFLWRRPPAVSPELDTTGLLAETRSVGCVLASASAEELRLGCVLFGPAGDRLSTQTLRRLQATIFDSTLGMILNLEGATREVLVDPEPGAGYLEAVLDVATLLPGLRVIASVPLAHLFEGAPPPPAAPAPAP